MPCGLQEMLSIKSKATKHRIVRFQVSHPVKNKILMHTIEELEHHTTKSGIEEISNFKHFKIVNIANNFRRQEEENVYETSPLMKLVKI